MLRPGTDDATVREILTSAYRNITTNGAAGIEPGAIRSTTMADRYGRRRAFEWTSDHAWLEFNRTLGVGDDAIGELMVRHLDRMARDLVLAQTPGPDPDAAARTLLQMTRKGGLSDRRLGNLEDIYFHSSGKAATPVSEAFALAGQGIRSGLASAQLSGAILSAPTDFAFTNATASWNGLDMTRIMSRYVEGLNPTNRADRLTAMRRGLILENGLRGFHDAARDAISDTPSRKGTGASLETGLSGAARIAGRAAEVVMRAQGLAHHTQILRNAVGMEFQAHWFDQAAKSMRAVGRRSANATALRYLCRRMEPAADRRQGCQRLHRSCAPCNERRRNRARGGPEDAGRHRHRTADRRSRGQCDHTGHTLQMHGQVRQIECSFGASTSNQKRDVFIAYLKANPQSRHLGSPLLFMRAMAEAFPCAGPQVLPPTDREL